MQHKYYRLPLFIMVVFYMANCQVQQAVRTDDMHPEKMSPNETNMKTQTEDRFIKRVGEDALFSSRGVSYGCYREGQEPNVLGPSDEEILEDLAIISEYWEIIRVYGAEDDSERILKLIHENEIPLHVMLGVWLENETARPERLELNQAQAKRAIALSRQYPDEIVGINVGNETQVDWSWHRMAMNDLIKYIRMIRKNVSVPVTTADDYNFWNKPHSGAVADEIDFIILHAHPVWNGQLVEYAVQWTDSVYQDIQSRFPEMTIVLGETGWATRYDPTRTGPGEEGVLIKGDVSVSAQEVFLNDFYTWVFNSQIPAFLFEAFDEPWKGGGDQTGPDVVEKHWGVFNEDRTPKASFENQLKLGPR